jgi:CRP-like cAMP-binding protein
MMIARKKPTAAKLRSWRVIIMRSRGKYLGPSKRLIAREVALGLDRVGDRSADVRTLEQSEFYVADAPAILAGDPTVALYVAAMLARRLDAANRSLSRLSARAKPASLPA